MTTARRNLLLVAAAGVLPVIVLFRGTLGEDRMVCGHDVILQLFPLGRLGRECWSRGEPPFWNPSVWCGTPYLAPANLGALSPLGLLTTPFSLETSVTLQPALALLLAFAGAAALAWRRTRDPVAATVAGAAFAFGGPVVTRVLAGHVTVLGTLAVLPFLLLGAEALLAGAGWGAAALIAAATAGLVVGGTPQLAYIGALVLGARLAVGASDLRRTQGSWGGGLRSAAFAALGGVLGVLLAAPQLLPGFEYAGESARQGGLDLENALYSSVGPAHLGFFLFPFFGGDPTGMGGEAMIRGAPGETVNGGLVPYWEVSGFVGVTTLALAAVAALAGRARFWLAVAGAALLFALGRTLPFYRIAHTVLPGFSLFRVPGRLLIVAGLALALAAAEGAAALRADGPAGDRARARAWPVAIALGLVLLVATFATGGAPGEEQGDALAKAWVPALAFGALAFALRRAAGGARSAVAPLAGLLVIELGLFSGPFVGPIAPSDTLWSPGVRQFLEREARGWRVDVAMAPDETRVPLNEPVRNGFRSCGGYDPAVLRRTMELYNLANGETPERPRFVSQIQGVTHLTPLLSCRFAFCRGRLSPAWREVYAAEGLRVYEMPIPPLPRAFLVRRAVLARGREDVLARLADPAFRPGVEAVVEEPEAALEAPAGGAPEPARIVEDLPHRVVVEAEAKAESLLMLLDSWYPGWEATVDGAAAPIARADHAFRGVRLVPGLHRVEFDYRCRPFSRGLALAGLGAAGVIALLALSLRSRRRAPAGAPPPRAGGDAPPITRDGRRPR